MSGCRGVSAIAVCAVASVGCERCACGADRRPAEPAVAASSFEVERRRGGGAAAVSQLRLYMLIGDRDVVLVVEPAAAHASWTWTHPRVPGLRAALGAALSRPDSTLTRDRRSVRPCALDARA
eukprot:453204-Prymnesium_polylepis.2